MKKILLLLLFTIASYGQAVFDEGIQIKGNANSVTATKVNVQETDGKVNTQTIKTGFNKNIGLGGSDVVGANTLLNQYSTTPVDWTATTFNSGQVVFYGGKQWIAKMATVAGDVPAVSSKWEEITFEALANKTVAVDQTIIDGSTNAVSGNAVFDGLALKSNIGHTHVASQITDLSKASVGLGNVDNTSDLSKPLSTATQTALNGKENSFTKNTAFNKNFGTTVGTVVEGGTLGTNAYNSTAYLPLSGGDLSGALTINSTFIRYRASGIDAAIISSSKNIDGGSSTDFNTYVYGNGPYGIWTNGVKRVTIGGDGNTTFSGTISASPATLPNQVVVKSQLDAAARPYKVYTALLSQTGTNAPVATVLENTLGGTVIWSRVSTGTYVGTLAGVFAVNKTICFHQRSSDLASSSAFDYSMSSAQGSTNTVDLKSTLAGGLADGLIIRSSVEIRVYN